jgi:hypothetical protein
LLSLIFFAMRQCRRGGMQFFDGHW